MRPKLITPGKVVLAVIALVVFAALIYWLRSGSKLPFGNIPSTAGKLAFVREENGTSDIYMADGATGANAVALTSDGKGSDNEPAWSPDGETVALTSDRNGVVRQVYLMSAAPGSPIVARTNTSTTKETPQYGPDGDVYYLDGGRISKLSPASSDIDAVFPTVDQKRTSLNSLFESGGVTRFAVSADGSRIFAAVKQDQGEELVVWVPGESLVAAFGIAEKILFRFTSDDNLIAVFINGQLHEQPIVLMNAETAKIQEGQEGGGSPIPPLPPLAKSSDKAVIRIGSDFKVTPLIPLPFAPSGMAIAPDGNAVALTISDKKAPGVVVFDSKSPDNGARAASVPASEPAFSPDGNTLAFVSGDDIYVVSATGGEPKNITGGKGRNLAPAWSPALPKK